MSQGENFSKLKCVGGWLGLLVGLLQGVFQCAPGKESTAEQGQSVLPEDPELF